MWWGLEALQLTHASLKLRRSGLSICGLRAGVGSDLLWFLNLLLGPVGPEPRETRSDATEHSTRVAGGLCVNLGRCRRSWRGSGVRLTVAVASAEKSAPSLRSSLLCRSLLRRRLLTSRLLSRRALDSGSIIAIGGGPIAAGEEPTVAAQTEP